MTTLFEQLKAGEIDLKQAKEMNNTAGKIIATAKVQLEYAAMTNTTPDIDFLNVDKK
jgi:hypothetical protein